MKSSNVRLILAREVRDQLRDRRTLFMIFVLPMLLYPLLGTAFFKMDQFRTQKPMTVLVFGGGQLASAPTPLIEDGHFSPGLFENGSDGARLLTVEMAAEQPPSEGGASADSAAEAARKVQAKECDAALSFLPISPSG